MPEPGAGQQIGGDSGSSVAVVDPRRMVAWYCLG